jgi:hypothetical protein
MEVVKIKKSVLLNALKKNRQAHRAIFEEAQEGYRAEAIKLLDKALQDAKYGRKITTFVKLNAPIDQTKDYDRAIKMIEMSVDENIEISEFDFACYILDDWSWKQNVMTTNAFYLSKK